MSKYKFSERSNRVFDTVESNLTVVFKKALDYGIMDATALEGHRNKAKQDRFFDLHKSKVQWPNGKHNIMPSKAVDVVPYVNGSVSWNWRHCLVWAGIVLAAATELGVEVRWGGNWDMDGEPVTDQDFQDLVHFELVG